MQIGIVGLGRMGANIARRLIRGGHHCTVYDLSEPQIRQLTAEGATGATTIAEFAQHLARPRVAWIMVPAGAPTEQAITELANHFQAGDTIIDGGNSYFKDDVRRAHALKKQGIHYLDAGTSGGVWGLERGYCLMIGGDAAAVHQLQPIFAALAPGRGDVIPIQGRTTDDSAEEGYLHCGPHGAGHFVKMIHNGIEYGLMQAYAEGFDILRNADSQALPADHRYRFDLGDIAELWRRGSVVSSWLLDLAASALAENADLARFSGHVHDSGEGRWTVQAALEESVPAEVLSASLYARFRSRQEHTFAEKLLSALREKFGGHAEPHTPDGVR